MLSITIVTSTFNNPSAVTGPYTGPGNDDGGFGDIDDRDMSFDLRGGSRVRETTITQDIPVRVLSAASVEGIHEPRCKEPDVHILLPSLLQLKNISERFTKLAQATNSTSSGSGLAAANTSGPRLELSANMHGSLRLSIATDALNICSVWIGLANPQLDPTQVEGGEEGIRDHPSTRMRALGEAGGEDGWAKVRIDGKDWGRVLSVGRLGGRVVACKHMVCDDGECFEMPTTLQASVTNTLSYSTSIFPTTRKGPMSPS